MEKSNKIKIIIYGVSSRSFGYNYQNVNNYIVNPLTKYFKKENIDIILFNNDIGDEIIDGEKTNKLNMDKLINYNYIFNYKQKEIDEEIEKKIPNDKQIRIDKHTAASKNAYRQLYLENEIRNFLLDYNDDTYCIVFSFDMFFYEELDICKLLEIIKKNKLIVGGKTINLYDVKIFKNSCFFGKLKHVKKILNLFNLIINKTVNLNNQFVFFNTFEKFNNNTKYIADNKFYDCYESLLYFCISHYNLNTVADLIYYTKVRSNLKFSQQQASLIVKKLNDNKDKLNEIEKKILKENIDKI